MTFIGIAATSRFGGRTVHKVFQLQTPLYLDSSLNIKMQLKEDAYFKDIDVFIWDEASRAPRYTFEVMDRTWRDVTNDAELFWGKMVVLGGDFRQLLSISVNSTRG